jgi:hypothetical protein
LPRWVLVFAAALVAASSARAEASKAEITVLYDVGKTSTMKKDWGFSALIEYVLKGVKPADLPVQQPIKAFWGASEMSAHWSLLEAKRNGGQKKGTSTVSLLLGMIGDRPGCPFFEWSVKCDTRVREPRSDCVRSAT